MDFQACKWSDPWEILRNGNNVSPFRLQETVRTRGSLPQPSGSKLIMPDAPHSTGFYGPARQHRRCVLRTQHPGAAGNYEMASNVLAPLHRHSWNADLPIPTLGFPGNCSRPCSCSSMAWTSASTAFRSRLHLAVADFCREPVFPRHSDQRAFISAICKYCSLTPT
jgi:hypothetical protein